MPSPLGTGVLLQQLAVDPVRNLVQVALYNGGGVSIIGAATNSLANTIGIGDAATGAALDCVSGRVYVVGHGSEIVVIDGNTGSIVKTIRTGARAN